MVRSVIFNQAPDWAKILGDSYISPNASEDRNEQLEKQNDAVRIANAGDAIKVFQAVAEFSSTAKKLADANDAKKKRLEKFSLLTKRSESVSPLADASSSAFIDDLETLSTWKVTDLANGGDYAAANAERIESLSLTNKEKSVNLQQVLENYELNYTQIADKLYNTTADGIQFSAITDVSQSRDILRQANADFVDLLKANGYTERQIRKQVLPVLENIDGVETKRLNKVNQEAYELKKEKTRNDNLGLAIKSEDVQGELAKQRKTISRQFPNGLGGALDWQVSTMVEAAKDGSLSTDKVREVLNGMELTRDDGNVETYQKRYGDKYNAAMLELQKADVAFVKDQKENEKLDYWAKETVAMQKIKETFPENGGVADIQDAINVLDVQGYEPTRLNNMLNSRKEGRAEIESKEKLFNDKKADGTLTVEEVEATENTYLINKFKEDAKRSETARKGDSYKVSRKSVEGMVKKVTGETLDTGPLSPESAAVQTHLNQFFEYAYQKQILADVDPDTAAINAGLATQKYFTDNGGGPPDAAKSKSRFYWNATDNNGLGGFSNFIEEFKTGLPGMDEMTSANPLTLKEMQGVINHNVDNVIRQLQSNGGQIGKLLDTQFAFLNQSEIAKEIERLNMGLGYSEQLKAYTAKFPKFSEDEIIRRQADALDPTGALAESIPEQPESLKTVYEKGIPELVCVMKKAGVANMSINQLSRLCTSISDKGTEDKELNMELFGMEEYPLRSYWTQN